MPLFRKKPVVITAKQYTGENAADMVAWAQVLGAEAIFASNREGTSQVLVIPTLEGEMTAQPGDWVIKGVKGEFYPCKPDIFAETYDAVE